MLYFKTPENMDSADYNGVSPFEQMRGNEAGAEAAEANADAAIANAEGAREGAGVSTKLAEQRLSILTDPDGDNVHEGVEAKASKQKAGKNKEHSTVTAALESMETQEADEMRNAMEAEDFVANEAIEVADGELDERQAETAAEMNQVLAEAVEIEAEKAQGFAEKEGSGDEQGYA